MPSSEASGGTHTVTGAFGYTGRYIASRLLALGADVTTLTSSVPDEDPFDGRVDARPLDFDEPEALRDALRGSDVLHNTYWVRFDHPPHFTFRDAVENSRRLFAAARSAGVRRVVHISITNPSEDSDLRYFSGKARVERILRESGLSHAILRPAVLFGREDVLINNIAWVLRRFPVFGVFGAGDYRVQPIHVDDLAALAVEQAGRGANVTVDAIGPETFSFRELVGEIGAAIGCRRRIVSIPPGLGYGVAVLLGKVVGDVVITRDEIRGLMAERLYVDAPPVGTTRLTQWARAHRDDLGRRYANELALRLEARSSWR